MKRVKGKSRQDPLWPCFIGVYIAILMSVIYLTIVSFWHIAGIETTGRVVGTWNVLEGSHPQTTMYYYKVSYTDRDGNRSTGIYRSRYPDWSDAYGHDESVPILYSPLRKGVVERADADEVSPYPILLFWGTGIGLSLYIFKGRIKKEYFRFRNRKIRERKRRLK